MLDAERLREILEDDLGCELDDVANDDKLFSTGIVDSFALVTLMMHIEKEAGIKIAPGDVVLENFDSVDRIVAYVERSLAA